MTDPSRRILIFGGTFDPPHRAHVELPVIVAEKLGCDRIIFVPAAVSPFKLDGPPTRARHRLKMVQRAVSDVPNAQVSPIEVDREGPSYFIDTLRALRTALDDHSELQFLIGAEHALAFRGWREWEAVLALATPVVLLRPPWTRERLGAALVEAWGAERGAWWLEQTVEGPLIDVSSTDLRRRLAAGEDPGDDLHPEVAAYIRDHGLYRRKPPGGTS